MRDALVITCHKSLKSITEPPSRSNISRVGVPPPPAGNSNKTLPARAPSCACPFARARLSAERVGAGRARRWWHPCESAAIHEEAWLSESDDADAEWSLLGEIESHPSALSGVQH